MNNKILDFFDLVLTDNLKNNKKTIYGEYRVKFYTYKKLCSGMLITFLNNGGKDYYHNKEHIPSYALNHFNLLRKKNINFESIKKVILDDKDSIKRYKSLDNIPKILVNPNYSDNKLSKLNGYGTLRAFAYLVDNYNKKEALKEAIRITKIANSHPLEVYGTYILYLSLQLLKKSPLDWYEKIIKVLKNIPKDDLQILVGDDNPKQFEIFRHEILAGLDEFIYNNYKDGVINKKEEDFGSRCVNCINSLISKTVRSQYKGRHIFVGNTGFDMVIYAIDLYIEFYKFMENNIVPVDKILSELVIVLGFSHHISIILSFYISNHKKADKFMKRLTCKL